MKKNQETRPKFNQNKETQPGNGQNEINQTKQNHLEHKARKTIFLEKLPDTKNSNKQAYTK